MLSCIFWESYLILGNKELELFRMMGVETEHMAYIIDNFAPGH